MDTIEAVFCCACCGEENETLVDPSAGRVQQYIEDCQVCCRPNMLRVTVGFDGEDATIDADYEE